jgi:hypothetical protein
MVLGQIGFFTTALESLATAVGAGVLLGTFAMAVVGLGAGWPRRAIEARALGDGCVGGVAGVALLVVDLAPVLWQ